jgi:hypothetical protein
MPDPQYGPYLHRDDHEEDIDLSGNQSTMAFLPMTQLRGGLIYTSHTTLYMKLQSYIP